MKEFFKHSPRREEVQVSDKIELLQLETREIVAGVELQRRLKINEKRLVAEINLPALLPYLKKQQVVTREETESLQSIEPERRNWELLHILVSKEPTFVEKFVDCLKESSEHQNLYDLLSE